MTSEMKTYMCYTDDADIELGYGNPVRARGIEAVANIYCFDYLSDHFEPQEELLIIIDPDGNRYEIYLQATSIEWEPVGPLEKQNDE